MINIFYWIEAVAGLLMAAEGLTKRPSADLSCDAEPSPKQVRLSESDTLPRPGALSPCQSQAWPEECLQALERAGLIGQFLEALEKGLVISTDYSGLGSAEACLEKLCKAAAHIHGFEIDKTCCYTQRGGDKELDCRRVLSRHDGVFAPRCIHGDILERCNREVWDQLETARQRLTKKCEKASAGDTAADAQRFLGASMDAMMDQDLREVSAWCYKHEALCRVVAKPATAGGLIGHVAGFNCYDWSSMGEKLGWLGNSTLAFCQWLAERLQASEHFCIAECTQHFDLDSLRLLVEDKFHVYAMILSPVLFGQPIERKRLYMIFLDKDKLKWREEIESKGVAAAFQSMFQREVMMCGTDMFRAPHEEVQQHVAGMARRNHLPPTSRSGKPWSCYQAMSASVRSSVDAHTKALAKQMDDGMQVRQFIANVAQKPSYMGATRFHVPALLRKSNLWLFGLKRLALPQEHLEIQGMNLYGGAVPAGSPASKSNEPAWTEAAERYRCSQAVVNELKSMSDNKIRSMSGNAMHMRVIGTVLAFTIAGTEKI